MESNIKAGCTHGAKYYWHRDGVLYCKQCADADKHRESLAILTQHVSDDE